MGMSSWDYWVEGALSRLESMKIRRSLRPIYLPNIEEPNTFENESENASNSDAFEVFDGLRQWDRASVEMQISEATFQKWLGDIPSLGDDTVCSNREADDEAVACPQKFKKLLLFSGNDYLGLSSHPTIAKAAAKAALEHGMGPRGSALICGYTNYHRLLESSLADLKKKEDERVAIFSDALNHASIIDGIRLAERRWNVEVFVYRHCDMSHLDAVLSSCTMEKKVVVTDSLFSMDGDFAPMVELVKLRRKHGFLLAIDDAHGTFVCGENGGGVPEEFKCESEVDICVGTLSKAAGCHGGFIACNKRWKQLIQSTGRSFIFSTAIPVPVVAAAHAAIIVAKRETWRRSAIRNRLRDFQALTGIPITSPIISLIVGSEEKALQASRHLLKSGFHVIAIRPPTVPAKSCRLRVTLSAAHTVEDLKRLTAALHQCINFQAIGIYNTNGYAKL
ncbi:8-amino-7-oxononanoate synthase isoform X2 [Cornus florida]|uniref:8-amino-7-oxononanoate synthase isoform X2 n=1 Tax=Cornus florida TaxID=4283 RepID=UPI00289B2E80|nr:8-amino-7-oxononanoate synthase isoform X2 [Cornus florida]